LGGRIIDAQVGALLIELPISVGPEGLCGCLDGRQGYPILERRLLHREVCVAGSEECCGAFCLTPESGECGSLQQGEPGVDRCTGLEIGTRRCTIQALGPIEVAGIPDRVGKGVESRRLDETVGTGLLAEAHHLLRVSKPEVVAFLVES
jgi:hypothetical protein